MPLVRSRRRSCPTRSAARRWDEGLLKDLFLSDVIGLQYYFRFEYAGFAKRCVSKFSEHQHSQSPLGPISIVGISVQTGEISLLYHVFCSSSSLAR